MFSTHLNVANTILLVVIFGSIISIIGFVLFTIITYSLYKMLKIKYVNSENIITDYSKQSHKILNKYKHCKIKNIYLVRHKISYFLIFLLDLISFNEWSALNNTAIHYLMVFEIEMSPGVRKQIAVSKQGGIYVSTFFNVSEDYDFLPVKIKNCNMSIDDVLNLTNLKMGTPSFHNWHISTNNCMHFVINILKVVGKYSGKYKQFVTHPPIEFNILTEFNHYVIHYLIKMYSFLQQTFF